MRCSSSYIKFYFTWVLDSWHSIKAHTSCFHEMKCFQIKLHLNKKTREEMCALKCSPHQSALFSLFKLPTKGLCKYFWTALMRTAFLFVLVDKHVYVFQERNRFRNSEQRHPKNIKGWCWWIKFVLFFQFRPRDFLIQICFLPFHKLRKHMHVDREKFDENRKVSGEPSRGLKLKQRMQAKMLYWGTKATSTLRPLVSGYFESATFYFPIRLPWCRIRWILSF